MAEPRASRASGESARIEVVGAPSRRLSDRIGEAIQQALAQGHREIAERLKLTQQALIDEDKTYPLRRRGDDWDLR